MVSSTCPIDQEDTKALGPAQSWGRGPWCFGGWCLAKRERRGLAFGWAAGRGAFAGCWVGTVLGWIEAAAELEHLGRKFSIAWNDFCAAVKRSATPSTAGQNRPVGQTGESRKGILWWCYLWWQGICPNHTVLYFIDLYRSVEMSHKWLAEPSSVVLCLHHCFYIKWPTPSVGGSGGRVYVIFSVCDVTNPGSSSLESLPAVCCSPTKRIL